MATFYNLNTHDNLKMRNFWVESFIIIGSNNTCERRCTGAGFNAGYSKTLYKVYDRISLRGYSGLYPRVIGGIGRRRNRYFFPFQVRVCVCVSARRKGALENPQLLHADGDAAAAGGGGGEHALLCTG